MTSIFQYNFYRAPIKASFKVLSDGTFLFINLNADNLLITKIKHNGENDTEFNPIKKDNLRRHRNQFIL